jgi:hypothetical protein
VFSISSSLPYSMRPGIAFMQATIGHANQDLKSLSERLGIPSTLSPFSAPYRPRSGRGYAMTTPTVSTVMVEDTLPCILPQDWPLYYPPK